jgi:HEAT repeat protein
VSRARLLPADTSDDLLTLLWAEEFEHISFRFAEVVTEPWLYDPPAPEVAAVGPGEVSLSEQIREELTQPRLAGVVDPQDFNPTLYFLDEVEIAEFQQQVAAEYQRDHQADALATLFDIFELADEFETRIEVLDTIEALLPVLLARGDFRTVALAIRELRTVLGRAPAVDDALQVRADQLVARLSAPEVVDQLLQVLDTDERMPAEDDLGDVLRELRVPALRAILEHLPRVRSERIRAVVSAAAQNLAAQHVEELARLLGELGPAALPDAMRLAGQLGNPVVIAALGGLARHPEATVRRVAVEVLATIGTPGAMAAVEQVLEDPVREVRGAALAAVTARRHAGALHRLEQMVQGRSALQLERGERRAVFEAYATVGGPATLQLLRALLQPRGVFRRRLDPDTRTCAVYAVGRIRSPEARALLEDLTGDRDLPVRHAAQSLLREWTW